MVSFSGFSGFSGVRLSRFATEIPPNDCVVACGVCVRCREAWAAYWRAPGPVFIFGALMNRPCFFFKILDTYACAAGIVFRAHEGELKAAVGCLHEACACAAGK